MYKITWFDRKEKVLGAIYINETGHIAALTKAENYLKEKIGGDVEILRVIDSFGMTRIGGSGIEKYLNKLN